MKNFFKQVVLVSAVFFAVGHGACLAQQVLARPQGYVSDAVGVMSPQQIQVMENFAHELERKTTAQLAVVIVPSVRPDSIEQYAVRLFEQWGIGQRGKDNGVLFLVAVNDREVRIEVGYGLEGALTDAVSQGIITRFVVPAFQQGLYDQGIQAGTAAMVSVIAKEYGVSVTGQEQQVYQTLNQNAQQGSPLANIIFLIIVIVLFILNPRLFFYIMLTSMMGGRGRSSWSGGGGGFGGGFGGFGGGMSGGGGASGRW